MNKIQKLALGIAMMLMGSMAAHAQFTLSGELRPRTEYSHGYKTLAADAQDASFFTSQRTRLNFDFTKDKLSTGLVLQDVRLWGSQPQLVSNEDRATSIHQAWLEYSFTPAISLKAGRQELVYDNSRIFGNVGWAQQARSHDLALLKYSGKIAVHLGVAYHEDGNRKNNLYLGPDAYKTMQFLWLQHKAEQLKLSFLFLNNGVPIPGDTTGLGTAVDQGISFSQTLGPVVSYSTDLLMISGEAYHQMGKDAAENTLSAWYGKLEAGLKLSKLSFFAGYEYLSGTAYDETGGNKSFTPFYGTNHKFNGYMDYFYVGNHVNNVGLQDIYLKAKTKLGPVAVNADLHLFNTAAEMSAGASSYLGTEIDLVCSWKIDDQFSVSAGYSHMFAGDGMSTLKGGSLNTYHNWAWLMLSVKPRFLQVD